MNDPDVVSGRSFWRRVTAYKNGRDHGPRCFQSALLERRLREYDRHLRVSWHFDGIDNGVGCWAVWRLTDRYVPHGVHPRLGPISRAEPVPHLVMRVKPEFLTLDIVEAVKSGDLHKRDRMKLVDEVEKQEQAVTADVQRKAEDVYREMWSVWHLMDNPHSFVPKSYRAAK